MPRFIKLRCPNRPRADRPDWECRGMLGGPALETLARHDFEMGPFSDMRYCAACQAFVEVSIPNLVAPVRYRVLSKKEHFDTVPAPEAFAFAATVGRRVR